MIIDNDVEGRVTITIVLERPTNVFQDELLIDTLKEMSLVEENYDNFYQEYL